MSTQSITSTLWTIRAKIAAPTTPILSFSTTKMSSWTACRQSSSKYFRGMLSNCATSSSWWILRFRPASSTAWRSMNSSWCWNSNKSTSWWSSSCSRWRCRVSRSSKQWANCTVQLQRRPVVIRELRSSSDKAISKEASSNNNGCGQSSASKNSKCIYNTLSSNRKKWGKFTCCNSNNNFKIISRSGTRSAPLGSLISIQPNK